MSAGGIYMITNIINGKFYIGSSANCARRFLEHKSRLRRGAHKNIKLQNAWNKHKEENFTFVKILSVFEVNDLLKFEQWFIDLNDSVATGYNIAPTAGSTTGWKANDETRVRMSEAAKKRDHSIQVIAMRAATKGKNRPQYVIDAMQKGRKDKPLSDASRLRMAASAVARSRYDMDARHKMVLMRDSGATWRAIAEKFGVTGHAAVMKYVKDWKLSHGM